MIRAAVVGAAGYIGGELLRLLVGHPEVELAAATSTRLAGRRVDGSHPNLRGLTDLTFMEPGALGEYDVLFLAVPHRESMSTLAHHAAMAKLLIDLSGDFRLADPATYERYYGVPHREPGAVASFVGGPVELNRGALRTADRISVPGCMATAAILAVHPLAADGLVQGEILVDARTGSSGSGATSGPENQHAVRSRALRVYAPHGHRHVAEISQALGLRARMTVTAVEAVRGVQVLCHATLAEGVDERTVRRSMREHYEDEPFVRVVAERRGLHRHPDPKILSGSNYCDVGFVLEHGTRNVLLMGALDNLVKGGAGAAVQAMNVRQGWPESLGLTFPGLHPN
jgi:N-acetyl-gamma-glutamyl-phosphate/LysW-gamma-L-alpha-aminoadipyl-6-phosphate reductase